MSGIIYQEKHYIAENETDLTGKASLGKMVELMLLASSKQSDMLGVSEKKLNDMGYGWVITQHLLEITRLPIVNEEVTVETQATAYNRYFTYRDFYIKDKDGEILLKMHTSFVMLDLKARKITRIIDEMIAPFAPKASKKIERLPIPEKLTTPTQEKNYQVRYFDIDSNRHVNNVHYFEWMLDVLGKDFLVKHDPVKVNIKYEHELYYDEVCTSRVELVEQENLTTVHEILRPDGTLSCHADIEWK